MIRLIIEGEAGKSEHSFWDTLLKSTPHSFVIYSAYGNGQGEATTRKALGMAQKGDIIILGLDKYTWSTYKTCEKLLRRESQSKGFTLMKLGARSFEGVFVSYSVLPSLVNTRYQEVISVFNDVAVYLRNKRNFTNKLNDYKTTLAGAGFNPKAQTQEQFVAWILNQTTRTPKGRNINKSEIGSCWLTNCCNAHPNTKRACPLKSTQYMTYWAKMLDLEANSLMHFNTHTLAQLRGQ